MTKWLERLEEEDIQFIKRFVLVSGSLKELAVQYGVTYPTIRLRLDRLIEKIKVLESAEVADEFERVLRGQFADGRIESGTFDALLRAHKESLKDQSKV